MRRLVADASRLAVLELSAIAWKAAEANRNIFDSASTLPADTAAADGSASTNTLTMASPTSVDRPRVDFRSILGKELRAEGGFGGPMCVPTEEATRQAELVGVYFGADWCKRSRHFAPKLAQAYSSAAFLPC